jgi:mRNA interferase MazF
MLTIQRGDVWWVDFNPSVGGEIQKVRPAVVISNNAFNRMMNRVQVVPVTSNTARCYPCEAYIEVNGKMGKAMADQLATVSKLRLKSRMGQVSEQNLLGLEQAIKIQLGL